MRREVPSISREAREGTRLQRTFGTKVRRQKTKAGARVGSNLPCWVGGLQAGAPLGNAAQTPGALLALLKLALPSQPSSVCGERAMEGGKMARYTGGATYGLYYAVHRRGDVSSGQVQMTSVWNLYCIPGLLLLRTPPLRPVLYKSTPAFGWGIWPLALQLPKKKRHT